MAPLWTLPLLLLTVAQDLPPDGPSGDAEVDRVIAATPALRDRRVCVGHVHQAMRNTRRKKTNLARAAIRACVPSGPWLRVFTGSPPETARHPGSTYVDRTDLKVIDRKKVRFWLLVEHFENDRDFYLGQWLLDCVTGKTSPQLETTLWAGIVGPVEKAEPRWRYAQESYQGAAVMDYVCTATETRLAANP